MKTFISDCLKLFAISSISFTDSLLAEEWAIQDGITVQRYCRGEEVRYSTTTPKDFELCIDQESKGSFNKATGPAVITQKDFSDSGKITEMTAEERRRMARDLRSIQDRRAKEAPQDMIKEINKIVKSWQSDPNFRKQIMQGLTPEEQKMIQQLPLVSIKMITGVLESGSKSKSSR